MGYYKEVGLELDDAMIVDGCAPNGMIVDITTYLSPRLEAMSVEELQALQTSDHDDYIEQDVVRWNLISAELRRRGVDAEDIEQLGGDWEE